MPRRNKIELQGLVDRIVDLFYKDKLSQVQIADKLKDEGYDVSKSGVGRTLLTHSSQMKAYRDAAKESVEIIRELKGTPGLDIAEATVQIVQTKLLQEVKKFDNFEELKAGELLTAVGKNTLAQARIAKIQLDYEKGYRQGLFRAAEVLELEGKKAGLSAQTVALIKQKITGQKVPHE